MIRRGIEHIGYGVCLDRHSGEGRGGGEKRRWRRATPYQSNIHRNTPCQRERCRDVQSITRDPAATFVALVSNVTHGKHF